MAAITTREEDWRERLNPLMNRRAILWISSAGLLILCAGLSLIFLLYETKGQTNPLRRASVVVPLLNEISPNDSPESVFAKITKILGNPDFGSGGGPIGHNWEGDYYRLDDKTEVCVSIRNNSLTPFGPDRYGVQSISIKFKDRPVKQLYTAPKT